MHWQLYYVKQIQIKNTKKGLENLEDCNRENKLITIIDRYERELKKQQIELKCMEAMYLQYIAENKVYYKDSLYSDDDIYKLVNGLEYELYSLETMIV